MNKFDFFYINTFQENNKRPNIILSTTGIVSLFYSNILGTIINLLSILIDYRIFKNVVYNIVLFLMIIIINFTIYERFKRRVKLERNFIPIRKYIFIDILYFIAFIALFLSVYFCNKYFGI